MQDEPLKLSAEQMELERALSGMVPAGVGIDRDAMMFAAGRASVHQPMVWAWKVAACVGFSLSVGLGIVSMRGADTAGAQISRGVQPVLKHEGHERVGGEVAAAYVSEEEPLRVDVESSQWSYFNLRNEALRWGVNVLPTAPNGGAGGAVVKEERAVKGFSIGRFIFNAGGRS